MARLLRFAVLVGAMLLQAAPAQVAVHPERLEVVVPEGQTAARFVTITNTGSQVRTFCLDFDRPAERSTFGCGPAGEEMFRVGRSDMPSPSWNPYSVTTTPDGRVFVSDYSSPRRTLVLTSDLIYVYHFPQPRVSELGTSIVTGITYNEDTGTLWWTHWEQQGLDIRRIMLIEGDLDGVVTGRRIVLPRVPGQGPYPYGSAVGTGYEPAEKRYYYLDAINQTIWAVDTLGQPVEGYPVTQTAYPNGELSRGPSVVTDGRDPLSVRLEVPIVMNGHNVITRLTVVTPDGRPTFQETPLPFPRPGGSPSESMDGVAARSRIDPNGVLYVPYSDFGGRGVAAVRPVRLPPTWMAVSDWSGTLLPGESASVMLVFLSEGREKGRRLESTLQVQTEDEVIRVPISMQVAPGTSVDAEAPARAFEVDVYPHPVVGASAVRLVLPAPAKVRAEVYDVLGRRVALLYDGRMEAGAGTLRFDGSSLPSGVYVLMITGNGIATSRRVTVVR